MPCSLVQKEFTIWRRLSTDPAVLLRDKEALTKMFLQAPGVLCTPEARDFLLQHISFAELTVRKELPLAKVSVEALGFPKGSNCESICAGGLARGLELCPAMVGPLLRLQYRDQPCGERERVHIAMEGMPDWLGRLKLFVLVHHAGTLLLTCSERTTGSPYNYYGPGCSFVFVLPSA